MIKDCGLKLKEGERREYGEEDEKTELREDSTDRNRYSVTTDCKLKVKVGE